MQFTGERFIPGEVSGEIEIEHYSRYYAISHILKEKNVLDLACGDGYGSFHISETAKYVLGVDIDAKSVRRAQTKYQRPNLKYCEGDATNIPAEDLTFDVVVSFETIEHITGEQQQAFLREIQRVLKPDGVLIMSTPDKRLYSDISDYHNKYHIKEFYAEEFEVFLRQAFSEVIFLRHGLLNIGKQSAGILYLPEKDSPFSNYAVDVHKLPYIVAVCANHDVKEVASKICKIYVAPPNENVSVDLFFDQGSGFTHSNKMMKSLKPEDHVFHICWEWDKTNESPVRLIKFDPLNAACRFHLLTVKTNIEDVALKYPNAKLENGVYYFYDMDPGIIFSGTIPSVGYLDIAYEMTEMGIVDLIHLVAEQEIMASEISILSSQWKGMQFSLDGYEQHMSNMRNSMNDLKHYFDDMRNVMDNHSYHFDDMRHSMNDLNHHFDDMSNVMNNLTHHCNDMQSEIDDRDRQINDMQSQIDDRDRQLSDIRNSRAWALMQMLWKIRDFVIPMNSRRRLLAKLAYKTVRSPRQMMEKLTVDNARKLWCYMRTESPAEVEARIAPHLPMSVSLSSKLALLPLRSPLPESLAEYEPLAFPAFDEVAVSIIIPVYNQFDYTYNCLCAILRHTEGVPYEILLADDVSTDFTKDIESLVSNITILHNAQNLGFLRNCNAAAAKAKGKYIFFLNNDTQVQPDWLPPLVKLLDEHADIGMTGSKLMYPDGHLQEAGGIFWRDGSAWNYGHGQDPDAPEFNYVKDVDYISGAAIMIRRELWENLGGFDERFVPAYCEDADLAFAVRQKGYRVIYQPLSVVVHFEGVSNGRDVKKGVKRYQVENQQKFYEKWKNVLEEENFPSGEEVFWARDRSRTKKTILVIDHYVPHFDQDAGSRTAYQYMQMFLELGLHVIFVGDNFVPHQPYTTVLEQLGIEVLAGNGWSRKKLDAWLLRNGKYIDVFYLSRPHISIHYLDMIRKRTRAQIIYYDVDLHFLREQREYEKEKDLAILESSKKWKKIECEIVSKSDVIFTAGTYEASILLQMFPEKNIHSIPIYLYDDLIDFPKSQMVKKNNSSLLFVGGFAHKPNLDAMLWFLEDILPLLLKEDPEIVLYIIGSNSPKKLEEYANEHVILLGYINDEELEAYYQKTSVAVVPLRFGAGVKGKVIEALYMGIPIVTTMIGAEGIPGAEQAMLIADDEKMFAQCTLRLLKDQALREKQIQNGWELIRNNFTKEVAKEFLRNDIRCLHDTGG